MEQQLFGGVVRGLRDRSAADFTTVRDAMDKREPPLQLPGSSHQPPGSAGGGDGSGGAGG